VPASIFSGLAGRFGIILLLFGFFSMALFSLHSSARTCRLAARRSRWSVNAIT
jgi:hypothetical protein